ncbi:MAG: NIPSNAP family protein [Alphaproteobacteria bacterium]|nr:NIPSNAP family protein [Alphaproteobacteria bacterium]
MTCYELAYLGVANRFHGEAAAAILSYCKADAARGELLGLWAADVGDLNRIAVFRRYAAAEIQAAERRRLAESTDPFGCGGWLMDWSLTAYGPFIDLPPIETGKRGPFYEVRTYDLRIGGLEKLRAAWRDRLPGRAAISPLLTAMISLEGVPRFTHIWPYPSMDARTQARDKALAGGAWPPNAYPGQPPTRMRNFIFRPLPGSPLC